MEVWIVFSICWVVSLNMCDTNRRSYGQQSGVFTLKGNAMAFALYYWKKEKDRQREKEKRRPPIKTDQHVFSHSLSLSLWRTLTFSSPLLYNVGRFCVDPENKQHSGGEGDLFALTLLVTTVVIRSSSASKRKRNREERIEEKICSSHVHSSLFLQYTHIHIYIGTPSREYMSKTRSERERVHMNNERIWTIEERIRSDEKWLLTTLFCCSLGVG